MRLNYGSMAAKGPSASKIPSEGSGGTENMERSTSAGVLMTRRNVACGYDSRSDGLSGTAMSLPMSPALGIFQNKYKLHLHINYILHHPQPIVSHSRHCNWTYY